MEEEKWGTLINVSYNRFSSSKGDKVGGNKEMGKEVK
jgi:hypothetical protein